MSVVGADAVALRRFAAACVRRQHELDAARRRLAVALEGVTWAGADRQAFLAEWQSVHAATLAAVAGELAAAARQACYHAALQEQASRSW